MLLHQPAVHTKLGSVHICYFVTDSPYHPSQLPHLPSATSAHTLLVMCLTRQSRCIYQVYGWNTLNVAIMTLQMMTCCAYILCKGIKRSQGDTSRPRLPVTINVLKALKTQLRNSSCYSLVEKRLLWSAFTLAFYAFLRAG